MRFLRVIVLVMALGPTLLSAPPVAGPSIEMKAGSRVWNAWRLVYNQAYPGEEGYKRFKKEVAELNPTLLRDSSDKSFKKIPRKVAGKITRITLPALPGTTASASEIAAAKADQKAIDDAAHNVDKAIWETEKRRLEEAYNAAVGTIFRNRSFWFAVIAALLIGGGLAYVLTRRHYEDDPDSSEMRQLRAEATHLRHQLRDSDARDHFLHLYTHAFEVPDDLGKVFGKTKYIYLLKADPIEGEDAVYVHGESLPVKVRNLKRFFFDARTSKPHVLEYYKITTSDGVPDTAATGRL